MRHARWYFDIISPYAYLAFKQFGSLHDELEIEYVPVLFAGLLKHWEHKGPAEIPAKRVHTYRACVFAARQLGVPFRMPPAHPFNPLHALRLLCAAPVTKERVAAAFDFIWNEGRDVGVEWDAFCQALGITDDASGHALTGDATVKQRLIDNTAGAVAAGVYGVPTFALEAANGTELFWGADMLPMLRAYLANPALFEEAEMARVSSMPIGKSRTG